MVEANLSLSGVIYGPTPTDVALLMDVSFSLSFTQFCSAPLVPS